MDSLIVKNVSFCGAELIAVQEKSTGKIYVGINSILRELGFGERQIEYRRDKWTQDKVVGKGTLKFSGTLLGAKTGKEVWCMEIKRLPLALAKIEITPNMEKEMPGLAEKLERYQDECADVLAAAFLPKRTRRKPIKQQDTIKSYATKNDDIIIVIGEDVYVIDVDDLFLLSNFESKLREMGVNQISDVIKAYMSVRFEKLDGQSIISDDK